MSKTLTIAAIAFSSLIAACSTHQVGTESASGVSMNAGFLSNYSNLRPVEGKEGIQRYIDRSRDVRRFSKLYIDPVQVVLSNDPQAYKGVQPDVLKRMADSFRTEFVSVIQNDYQIVNAPGPDVVRIRLAITGVQPVNP